MTSHERAYKFRFYPDATQESIMESVNKNDYHTISASNDNHMKPMRAERKPQNEPVKQDTHSLNIIALNALIAIILSTVFNANILVIAYLTASVIVALVFIVHTWFWFQ